VSRAGIASFDPSGVAMVCIAYPEITGSTSDIRNLVRRLRGRMPKATIVVGFWPPLGPILAEKAARDVVAADHHVASLREAVIACLETVRSTSAAALVASR